MLKRWLIVSTLSLGGALAARAQGSTRPPVIGAGSCGQDSTGLGRISGMLVPDAPGLRVGQIQIINAKTCMVRTDATGGFMIRGVPPGDYALGIASFQMSAVTAVIAHVVADSTANLTIHLRPADAIAECMAMTWCAPLIGPAIPASLAALSDTDRVREVALRTAIMLRRAIGGVAFSPFIPPLGYCLAGDRLTTPVGAGVVEAVRRVFPTAVAVDGCGPPPVGRAGGTRLVGTNDRAIFFSVNRIVIDGDHATAAAMGDGTFWACTFERSPSGWRPISCRVTGIS